MRDRTNKITDLPRRGEVAAAKIMPTPPTPSQPWHHGDSALSLPRYGPRLRPWHHGGSTVAPPATVT